MTVSSQVNRKDYSGNGSTTAFATEFRFLEDSHLRIILTVDSTGVETVQSITTNYTVTGKGEDSGGTVTMIIAPATGETLTIKRDVPVTQQTDYVENDDFPAESHERALDKGIMISQQQQEELDRSLKLSEGQISSGLTIPAPETGKFLQWDALGNFINVTLANLGTIVAETIFIKDATATADNIVKFSSTLDADDSGISIDRMVQIADAAGPADVLTATFSPAVTALTDGLEVRVRALLANATTTPTVNYNGLGAKTIVKNGNQPLAKGDIAGPDHELQLVSNTGNDNVELMNPASTPVLTKPFVSTAQTITSGGSLVLAHFLGVEPKSISMILECVSAQLGYSVGDRLVVNSSLSSSISRAGSVVIDDTNVTIRFSNETASFVIGLKTNGVATAITNASWQLHVRAYA